jgi:hypothetical protein
LTSQLEKKHYSSLFHGFLKEPEKLGQYKYGLDGRGFVSQQGQNIFLHCVQTASGAHPASYTAGTGGSFGGKAAGA